jgi:hypothetical protein
MKEDTKKEDGTALIRELAQEEKKRQDAQHEERIKAIRESGQRSGYEIRLDLVKEALKLADSRYNNEFISAQYNVEKLNDMKVTPPRKLEPPVDTRVEDAVKDAKKLYDFVQTK